MKILSGILILLFSLGACAKCPPQQDIDIQTEVITDGVQAGGDHGFMDLIRISAPRSIDRFSFQSIQLTYGEVSEFWIPLATEIDGDRVVATISGYPESIKIFEFWVNYSDGKCPLYQAGSIGSAYNKSKQQGPAAGTR